MSRRPITKAGYEALMKNLKHLQTVERQKAIRDIEEARAHGDLSENAEYDAAKERQGYLEAKIKDLETKLSLADIIDPATLPRDRVVFGAKVLIRNLETEEEETYQLVGPDESNLDLKKISIYSPVGDALLGKRVEDVATVHAPRGIVEYEVVEISFD